jgi:hypothetical protein
MGAGRPVVAASEHHDGEVPFAKRKVRIVYTSAGQRGGIL